MPSLRKTVFGWVLSGSIDNSYKNPSELISCTSTVEISNQLRKFWEIEEVASENHVEDTICEKNFVESHKRLPEGRFEVTMPFQKNFSKTSLGDSLKTAEARFFQLERRLSKNQTLRSDYIEFINEYIKLGHMEIINSSQELAKPPSEVFYLPHHAVLKESSTTTKLRVVFNGSQKTSSGNSLNDVLLCGPTVQDDLFSILLRFRFHTYVFSADIAKMYRQVSINPCQRDFLRILWRNHPDETLSHIRLTTVTYGTKPAAFLATRCLKELSFEFRDTYPLAAEILDRDCYVDNILTGAQTLEEILALHDQLMKITSAGCFPLRKWCSNNPIFMKNVNDELRETSIDFSPNSLSTISTLGLSWSPINDNFVFKFDFPINQATKRSIVSETARIFDPLGLLAPLTIRAKIIIQLLWLRKMEWDTNLDLEIMERWNNFRFELNKRSEIFIPRQIGHTINQNKYVLHAFCDSSKMAYAACIFTVCSDGNELMRSNLICAKTRVAPLKPLTIARLELCGALLSSKLLKKVFENCNRINIAHCYLWCDSQIVLHWLNSPASKWKVFIANRVSQIHEILKDIPHTWRYVPSKENPADFASRGITIDHLVQAKLWWHGPEWLIASSDSWPSPFLKLKQNDVESDHDSSSLCLIGICDTDYFISNYSSLSKIIRIVIQIFRFKEIALKLKTSLFTTAFEYRRALNSLIFLHQRKHFPSEISDLEKLKPIRSNSKVLGLNPFLDQGLLRVGGRLKNAHMSYGQRHPYLLASHDVLTELIIEYEHKTHYHAAPQLLRSIILKSYWIVKGISTIKRVIRRCLICAKLRRKYASQLMGNLPISRVEPCRPFERCGIDYAGPFLVKRFKGRCNVSEKAYVCLFVCFVTRAIHIELVSELSTPAFIAALRRFIARRGKPKDIYSDNGKNFVGANAIFDEFKKFIQSRELLGKVAEFTASEFIEWHMIPAFSPHMGGLWEAGVKSVKTHLRTVLELKVLTFEELYTVLTEIEMCLNSRPLTEMSSDPADLEPLTPAHFLISALPSFLPETSLLERADNYLNRWHWLKNLIRFSGKDGTVNSYLVCKLEASGK